MIGTMSGMCIMVAMVMLAVVMIVVIMIMLVVGVVMSTVVVLLTGMFHDFILNNFSVFRYLD
jgi:hypothetical protein